MQEGRRTRLESVLQEELSHMILREVKDPRIPSVTLTAVELSEDASQATVFVSILGGTRGAASDDEGSEVRKKRMKECLKGLQSASGYLKRHLARALKIKHIPALAFREDKGFENAAHVHELLKKIEAR